MKCWKVEGREYGSFEKFEYVEAWKKLQSIYYNGGRN